MTLYKVQVQTETERTDSLGKWTGLISSPTFYLDSNVQGIVSEAHAERIVRDWLTDLGLPIASIVVLASRKVTTTILPDDPTDTSIGNDPTHPSWDAKY